MADEPDFVDDDYDWGAYREKRMRELTQSQKIQQGGYGQLQTVSEKEFLKVTTSMPRVIAHFFHKDFSRCKIMDEHLQKIASNYIGTKFVAVDAEAAPFLVTKLGIKTLPCLFFFKDGVVIDRLEGFDFTIPKECKTVDAFPTSALEKRLAQSGILLRTLEAPKKKKGSDSDDSDEDR